MTTIIKEIYCLLFRVGHGTYLWKKKFGSFGKRTSIAYPAFVTHRECIFIGANTVILKWSRIQNFNPQDHRSISASGCKIVIGDRCYIGFHFTILNSSQITIGNDVLIASQVIITSENHGINPESDIPYMNQPLESRNVEICDGCWIGEKVCIMPGVKIGKKSIIGAGSIVVRSIPDYCIAAGNPAKVIKKYNFETHNWEKV